MEWLKDIKLFLLDLDGTVYLGDKAIDGAAEAVFALAKSAQILYLTNNSSKTKSAYSQKLKSLGLPCSDNVYTSANATQDYLIKNHGGKRVYVFGNKDVRGEFEQRGVTLCEDKPDIAVVAFNTEFCYSELAKLCGFINSGVDFIATHPDLVCPVAGGFIPDAGSFLSLIKSATGKAPIAVCGKPYPHMARGIKRLTGVKPEHTAMVGDRLYTDIKFAKKSGFKSVLVFSGETDKAAYKKSKIICEAAIPSIKDLRV